MESLEYIPPDKKPDPDRQLVLRYIRVFFPPPEMVLHQTDTRKAVWEALQSLKIKLHKGIITGASYNTCISDNRLFKGLALTFDSVKTRNEVLKQQRDENRKTVKPHSQKRSKEEKPHQETTIPKKRQKKRPSRSNRKKQNHSSN